MNTPLTVTSKGVLALTEAELEALKAMLKAHDRGGFYIAYNAMTDSGQAMLQFRGLAAI